MSAEVDFFVEAHRRYDAANRASLRWMLERAPLHGVFLNTKISSISLKDYDASDGWRGPDWLYGWIQGRGLEAIVTQACALQLHDAALAAALDARGQALYAALDALIAASGHCFFCYDKTLRPVFPDANGQPVEQSAPAEIFTYSDAFAAKGLLAGAMRYAPQDVPRQRQYLQNVVGAIEAGRFQIHERIRLEPGALASQPDDFAPRMILLSGARLLALSGGAEAPAYADRFIDHVLARHLDHGSGLLRNVPGQDACNPGHAIEFVGFALDHLPPVADLARVLLLERIALAAYTAGLWGPGIVLSLSVASGEATSRYCPWWPLPECIRAAALAHERTASPASLDLWRRADHAFFSVYWRGQPPIAFQMLAREGPVDVVPATPDLDPGYHTGLSLLAAARVARQLSKQDG